MLQVFSFHCWSPCFGPCILPARACLFAPPRDPRLPQFFMPQAAFSPPAQTSATRPHWREIVSARAKKPPASQLWPQVVSAFLPRNPTSHLSIIPEGRKKADSFHLVFLHSLLFSLPRLRPRPSSVWKSLPPSAHRWLASLLWLRQLRLRERDRRPSAVESNINLPGPLLSALKPATEPGHPDPSPPFFIGGLPSISTSASILVRSAL